ncbi:MAG: hypothetical protein K6G27_04795 [Lachnospiraceae bacterium]|nr:hypothetical protein [Lachnospiraceae bacterium]
MMISPDAFILDYRDMSYEDLLPVRDELIDNIRDFEIKGSKGDNIYPSLSTRYQVTLEYLGKLCELIAEKYRDLQ